MIESNISLTLISEANVADVQVSFEKNRSDLRVSEKVEEMGIAWLLVGFHKPPVVVASDPWIFDNIHMEVVPPEQERLIKVNGGAISGIAYKLNRGILKDSPALDELLDWANGQDTR